ncbi:MAG: spermidine/putrescine ABC transporter substrate-binding protein [Actinomycetales bacterium]|nr:spermidine/putrescine ABC transporter substrate-binding protein [Actinomycetales bacterium]
MLQASALALPGAWALAACAREQPLGGPTSAASAVTAPSGATSAAPSPASIPIASPSNPVKWPINPGNEPIASGLEPEANATLRVYNYPDYLDKAVIKDFEKEYAEYGAKVEYSTFNDYPEALTKIRSGSIPYDVTFMTYSSIGRLVYGDLIRPLNHDYIPNISDVWDEFKDPWYDLGWQYTVPYVIYTTGIGWRSDLIGVTIGDWPNPYDVFWDAKYAGKIAVLDDHREVIGMTILRDGGTDVNTGDPVALGRTRDAMLEMLSASQPRVTITGYTDIPEGVLALSQCWSGDMVTGQYYMPEGVDPTVLRFWSPPDGRGLIGNDFMVNLKGGQNPVLAHHFINFMVGKDVSLKNFSWVGYQPPLKALTPESMVADGYVPKNLASAVIKPEWFGVGYPILELPPAVEAEYQAIWQQFKAGA